MKIRANINTAKILKSRGLGSDNRVRVFLASEVKRLSDPYVPMQQGILKNTAVVSSDGSTLTYTQPYAHYQRYGEVMAGRATKQYTGRSLSYHGGPMRGKEWTKRMVIDRRKDIEDSVEAYIGRLSK